MSNRKTICCLILCFSYWHLLQAQNIKDSAKKNPFTISGGIGASANFYTSNEPLYSQTSYSWNVYGNFTPKINKILLPFSFVINQYGNSNRSPYIQMGISPTYKWAKLHLGIAIYVFHHLFMMAKASEE